MWSSSSRDNWLRLVEAVMKREQYLELAHKPYSRSPTISTVDSDYSDQSLNLQESPSPSIHQVQLTKRPSIAQVKKNASGPTTWKLFSTLQRRRKPKDTYLDGIPEVLQLHLTRLRRFSLHDLQLATDNFSNRNVLGHGRHAKVYKGRLADGLLVAVKRLKAEVVERLTGELQEIRIELEVSSIPAHCNILSVYGFCFTEEECMLIFPYMTHGTVASYLRDRSSQQPSLNWLTRKEIAIGTARGLAYLHDECEKRIIHADVKAANVLLNEEFKVVIADFDCAIIMDHDNTDVIRAVKGIIGHIPPECLSSGKCSEKTDVYGYGIFLLELVTGQRAFDLARLANDHEVMLLDWVTRNYMEEQWKMLADPNCGSDDNMEEVVELLIEIALLCTQHSPEERPKMSEIIRMLEVGDDTAEWNQAEMECNQEIELRSFTFHELQDATEDFSNKIISEDGFNMLYKGWLDGSPVAVKRYNSQSLEYYFQEDLDIARIYSHPNIVHVIGFCDTPEEQMLVFRWMANGSVASWLRGRHESQPPLTWGEREKIALGAARGLAYLHDGCKKKIIHRDVKAANILLDENFEAVVVDFKLAKLIDHSETHVTTTVTGTDGHIAPEYLATGKCSDKTDVFGYGAFLLELITGKKTIDLLHVVNDEDIFCVDWVKRNYERRWELMVDEEAEGSLMERVVEKMVKIAVLCTQYDPDNRPKMSEVVTMFEVGGRTSCLNTGRRKRSEEKRIIRRTVPVQTG